MPMALEHRHARCRPWEVSGAGLWLCSIQMHPSRTGFPTLWRVMQLPEHLGALESDSTRAFLRNMEPSLLS